MTNTAYYQSLSKAYEQVCNQSSAGNRVPNAVRQLSKIYEGMYGYRKTASGKWREHDEPNEREQLRQADAIHKRQQQRKAAASRERLKAANKVPTKAGKRLFEDFMKDANRASGKKQVIRNREDLQQVYLSARALPFDKWLVFITEML